MVGIVWHICNNVISHRYMQFQAFQKVYCGKSTPDFLTRSIKYFHVCLECNNTLSTFIF